MTAAVAAPATTAQPKARTGLLRSLLSSRMALFGLVLVLFFVVVALLAPVIAPGDPGKFVGGPNQPPSAEFPLGTNHLGKDVFKQTVWGARNSLLVGFGTALLSTLVAIVVGMTAGYFRGRVDDVLTLIMNLFLVIPGLPLLIVLSGYLQPGTTTVIFVLTLTGWAFAARIVRSQALMLREKDFVGAAKVSGENDFRIIFSEILPNMTSILVGITISGVGYGIGAATALSFLGFTDISEVTWGTNLYWAQQGNALLSGAWWTFIPAGLCVALVIFGLSLINYAVDTITNPRLRAEKDLNDVIKQGDQRNVRATPVLRRAR
jgi:peptide/nickel transport system permease protein